MTHSQVWRWNHLIAHSVLKLMEESVMSIRVLKGIPSRMNIGIRVRPRWTFTRLCLERDDPADFSLDAPSLDILGMESCWEVYKIFPGVFNENFFILCLVQTCSVFRRGSLNVQYTLEENFWIKFLFWKILFNTSNLNRDVILSVCVRVVQGIPNRNKVSHMRLRNPIPEINFERRTNLKLGGFTT